MKLLLTPRKEIDRDMHKRKCWVRMKKKLNNLRYKVIYRFVKPKMIITGASFSGDGMFIDIRYWLSRPDKINSKAIPYLVSSDQQLGLMYFSRVGVMKSKMRKHTNTGMLLFYNKNKIVKIGDSVTLYWDGLQSDNIAAK